MAYNFNTTHDSTAIMPEQSQVITSSNYLDFQANGEGWNKQFLPELYEEEVERYGNRTLNGFLRMVGAEMPMTSDQVIWSEQNRLHIGYDNTKTTASDVSANQVKIVHGTSNMAIRKDDLVAISEPATGITVKAIVTNAAVATGGSGATAFTTIVVDPYNFSDLSCTPSGGSAQWADGDDVSIFVFGSEFAKGVAGRDKALQPEFTTKKNNPIIIKDYYEVSGSDASQIGWVEVATEDGTSGYLWYLKAESETRLRFEDYLEMTMVESVPGTNASTAGTQGLFHQVENGGNVYQSGAGNDVLAKGDFDNILAELDTQGAIEENMLFMDRTHNLEIDDMLAGLNAYYSGGTSYGLFDNDENMALNLGFSGFRRGSYDFYKTDWKYLNDATTRGMLDDIDGLLVPAGTSTVYDQMLGSNIRRPFLHVRYRASESEDRRMKSWILGSVGGAATSSKDVMEVHFLSERCLVVQGANNFVLFKNAV